MTIYRFKQYSTILNKSKWNFIVLCGVHFVQYSLAFWVSWRLCRQGGSLQLLPLPVYSYYNTHHFLVVQNTLFRVKYQRKLWNIWHWNHLIQPQILIMHGTRFFGNSLSTLLNEKPRVQKQVSFLTLIFDFDLQRY
jgi:hypothetical protein